MIAARLARVVGSRPIMQAFLNSTANQSIGQCRAFSLEADEVANAARAAKQLAASGNKSVFSKILEGTIPADIIYSDDQCIAFSDTNPQAPVHFLVIPRKPLPMFEKVEDSDQALLGHMLLTAKKVAVEQGLTEGYRIVINNGVQGAQSVYHMHLHVLGGRQMIWPPG